MISKRSPVRSVASKQLASSSGLLGRVGVICFAVLTGTASLSAQDATSLAPIIVEGSGESPIGPGTGYNARNTTTGSKTDTPLNEIPQSVSVVTRQELDDRQPAQLEDVIAYTAGVVASPWGMDDRFDECLIRGFDLCTTNLYRDGLSQRLIGYSGFKIEPYGMERVEVLKGPASVLYGENDVSGLVNAVTKRPTKDRIREAFVSYGSFHTVETGIDLGGPVTDDDVWTYRLTGLFRNGSTQTDFTENDRIYVAPAFTWSPDDATSLTILANYQSDRLQPGYSVPVPGMDGYTGPTVPRDLFTGSRDFDRFHADYGTIGYQFSHEFDNDWTFRQNVRYARQRTDYRQLYFGAAEDPILPVLPDGHTISRTAYTVDETASIFNLDNQLQYDAANDRFENKFLIGLDYNRWNVDGRNGYGPGPDLDILNPDVSAPVVTPSIIEDYEQTVGQLGLYLQNQTKVDDHLVLSLGLRQAWVENKTDDRLAPETTKQYDHSFVKQFGAAYLFDNGLTPYASYAESFLVNLGQTKEGANFVPSEGKQYELGVKYEPAFFDGSITAAVFDITKSNVLTADPDDFNFSVQTGEVRHRGFEVEAKAELDLGLSLSAAYTFLDAEITKSNDGNAGNRPSLVPEHTAALWANYTFDEDSFLPGVSVGAGVRYIGSSFGDEDNSIRVPGYTVADAALRFEKDKWEAALNVSNLFDKAYYATCYTGQGCFYGERRNIKASFRVKF